MLVRNATLNICMLSTTLYLAIYAERRAEVLI